MGKQVAHPTTSSLGLTEAGKVIFQGIGFVALAALVFPAFGILSALVWVALVALLAGLVLRPKVRLRGNLPDRVMAGQTVHLTYIVENIGRFPAYNLWLKFGPAQRDGSSAPGAEAIEQVEQGQAIPRLGPGQSSEVTIAIRPRRRGHYRIVQPTCLSSFPFNLFSFGSSAGPAESLIVLPAFSRLGISTRGPIRHVHAGSSRLAGPMGFSGEYAGNRPFVPGDSPRKIDARAWARLSVPATKEYHDDFDNHAALVLDTSVPDRVAGSRPAVRGPVRQFHTDNEGLTERNARETLEAAVSLCASLAFSINDTCLIDVLAAGPDLHELADRPRMVRLDKIHEILAGVEPMQAATPGARARRTSSGQSLEPLEENLESRFFEISDVFFVLLGWNKAYETLLDSAAQAGCRCTVLLVDGSGPSLSAPGARPGPEQDSMSRASYFRILSPDEILSGRLVLRNEDFTHYR